MPLQSLTKSKQSQLTLFCWMCQNCWVKSVFSTKRRPAVQALFYVHTGSIRQKKFYSTYIGRYISTAWSRFKLVKIHPVCQDKNLNNKSVHTNFLVIVYYIYIAHACTYIWKWKKDIKTYEQDWISTSNIWHCPLEMTRFYRGHGTCVCPSSACVINAVGSLSPYKNKKRLPDYWQAQRRSPSLNYSPCQKNVLSKKMTRYICTYVESFNCDDVNSQGYIFAFDRQENIT
jgi:hypothetical protein